MRHRYFLDRLLQRPVFSIIKNSLHEFKITLLNLFYPKTFVGLFEQTLLINSL